MPRVQGGTVATHMARYPGKARTRHSWHRASFRLQSIGYPDRHGHGKNSIRMPIGCHPPLWSLTMALPTSGRSAPSSPMPSTPRARPCCCAVCRGATRHQQSLVHRGTCHTCPPSPRAQSESSMRAQCVSNPPRPFGHSWRRRRHRLLRSGITFRMAQNTSLLRSPLHSMRSYPPLHYVHIGIAIPRKDLRRLGGATVGAANDGSGPFNTV